MKGQCDSNWHAPVMVYIRSLSEVKQKKDAAEFPDETTTVPPGEIHGARKQPQGIPEEMALVANQIRNSDTRNDINDQPASSQISSHGLIVYKTTMIAIFSASPTRKFS